MDNKWQSVGTIWSRRIWSTIFLYYFCKKNIPRENSIFQNFLRSNSCFLATREVSFCRSCLSFTFLEYIKEIKIQRKTPMPETLFHEVQVERLQLYQKETATQVFPCKFCTIFRNMYFIQHLQMAPSKVTATSMKIMCGLHKSVLSTKKMAIQNE